ncbi:hypothetical protein GT030_03875 [Streptomyces sp. SID1328]|nr:hypothetical protein [Streptomyces sp. SID1328]
MAGRTRRPVRGPVRALGGRKSAGQRGGQEARLRTGSLNSPALSRQVRVTQYAAGPSAPAADEWVDFRSSTHATAVGKSLLGRLGHDARRDRLSRHRTARPASRTITSDKLLLSRLESQPPTVPVPALQEYALGTVCAAVPITAGASVGRLAVSLPVERAHRPRRAADALSRHAAPVLLPLALQVVRSTLGDQVVFSSSPAAKAEGGSHAPLAQLVRAADS